MTTSPHPFLSPGDTPPPQPPARPVIRTPAPSALLIGFFALLMAGLGWLHELADIEYEWALLGPALLLCLGAGIILAVMFGLLARRRR